MAVRPRLDDGCSAKGPPSELAGVCRPWSSSSCVLFWASRTTTTLAWSRPRLRVSVVSCGSPPPSPTPGPSLTSAGTSSSSSGKLQPWDFAHFKKEFLAKYSGELLTPQSTPSLEFLSLLKQHGDSSSSLWTPWRLRTCVADAARWEESRKTRNDRHFLRQLLDSEADPPALSVSVNMHGPAEPVLRRALNLFATVLSMLDFVHLATIKKFNERFLDLALTPPIDTNLRPPSKQEILQADRAVWASIFELYSDHPSRRAQRDRFLQRGDGQSPPTPPRSPRVPPPPCGDARGGKGLGRKRHQEDPSATDAAPSKAGQSQGCRGQS
eukprot:s140_g32.t1